VKIGPIDLEIISLWAIFKKRKKLWKVYIARSASLPSGLIYSTFQCIYVGFAMVNGIFSKWRLSIICDFPFSGWKSRYFISWRGPEGETHHHNKFYQYRSIPCKMSWFFVFFKMAVVRHIGLVWGIFRPLMKSIWWSLSLRKIWFIHPVVWIVWKFQYLAH